MTSLRRARRGLAIRGSVCLEHLVLVFGVGIAVALGCAALGLALLQHHNEMEAVLGLPIP